MTPTGAEALRDLVARNLVTARERTELLTGSVDDGDLVRQHSPLMSPLVWDLAHVANQEELWLLREVGGREPMHPEIDPLYDAFEHPRAERPTLPLLPPAQARAYAHEVRGRVLDLIETATFSGTRLLTGAFAFGMIAQHEQQHDETMLITHQLRKGGPALTAAPPPAPPAGAASLPREVLIPAGPFTMGTSTEAWALDNERPAHTVTLPAFYLDTTPVTNAAYQEFLADGGYEEPRWWSPAGWDHRQRAGLAAPLYWRREGSGWVRTRFGVTEPVPPAEPVMHVSWYEAQAYAAWAGRRLPTEAEWEKAARHDPATGRSRRFPWGDEDPAPDRANLGQHYLQPAPRAATRAARARRACASSSVTCGSGPPATSCPTRASPPGPTRSIPRCSSAASTRCSAVARSASPRSPAGARSATGTTRSGGRSSRASAPPGTPNPPPAPHSPVLRRRGAPLADVPPPGLPGPARDAAGAAP